MSGSNDLPTRKLVYDWIAQNERHFYRPRQPLAPVGLYFSPKTRNYFAESFLSSYEGLFNLLLQSHLEFQVVTPRTLDQFKGKVLILPDTRCLGDTEISLLQDYRLKGRLYVTGEAGKYDETGAPRAKSFVEMLTDKTLPSLQSSTIQSGVWIFDANCPGKAYTRELKENFNSAAWSGQWRGTSLETSLKQFQASLQKSGYTSIMSIEASPFTATQIAMVDGKPHLFLVNFKGLKGKQNPVQKLETAVKVHLMDQFYSKAWFLDYLGEAKQLVIQKNNGESCITLPDILKGAILWFEK